MIDRSALDAAHDAAYAKLSLATATLELARLVVQAADAECKEITHQMTVAGAQEVYAAARKPVAA
jgi:hypothetical protein